MKITYRIIIAAVALILLGATDSTVSAQRLSDDQLRQGLAEMRNFKHKMLIRELELTKEQQDKFFDIYDQMDEELLKIGFETREMERKITKDTDATDTECKAAARTMFEQKKREGEVELKYFDRFAAVLTPQQLMKLKPADRKIAMRMAQYHGRKHGKKKM